MCKLKTLQTKPHILEGYISKTTEQLPTAMGSEEWGVTIVGFPLRVAEIF